MSRPCGRRAPEPLLLWIGLISGLIGAIYVVWRASWEVYTHLSGRTRARTRRLSRNVLRPWSRVELVTKLTRSEIPLLKALHVPTAALPKEARDLADSPYPGISQYVELDQLESFDRGKDFVKRKHPKVWKEWLGIVQLFREYSDSRDRMEALVDRRVREGMEALYPGLEPSPNVTSQPSVGRYVVENVVSSIMTDVYHIVYFRDETRGGRLSLIATQRDDVVTYELRGEHRTFLKVADESSCKEDKMRALSASWLADPELRKLAKDFVGRETHLNKALEGFGKSLQRVIDRIEYS